jgi:misacylated tRNA(Ala) deacylase
MTYVDDSYAHAFQTKIRAVETDGAVELEQTYFYPEGGGQPGDKGTLRLPSGQELHVHDTQKRAGRVVHLMRKHELTPGQHVHARIDWPRRHLLMRMHTAAHVISAVLAKHEQALITGNQLAPNESRIDYNLDDYNPKRIRAYQELINQELAKGHDVTTHTLPRKEAERQLKQLSTLAVGLPEHIQDVRVVRIGRLDAQACAGTHVKNTQEIGRVTFTKTKNKGASNRRVYYTLSQ